MYDMNKTTTDVAKSHLLGEFFNSFPETDTTHPFEFFLKANVDQNELVSISPLGTEWGFVTIRERENTTIATLRKELQLRFESLEKYRMSLCFREVNLVEIRKSDFVDEDKFYDFIQEADAQLIGQNTEDEHAIIKFVGAEVLS